MRAKIAPNLIKMGFHAYLSNSYLNLLSKLNSEKVDKSAYFQPGLRAKIAPNLIKLGVHAYLSNGYLNKISKLNSKKVNTSTSFQPWFDQL